MELQSGLIMLDGLQQPIMDDSGDVGGVSGGSRFGSRSVNEGSGLCG